MEDSNEKVSCPGAGPGALPGPAAGVATVNGVEYSDIQEAIKAAAPFAQGGLFPS